MASLLWMVGVAWAGPQLDCPQAQVMAALKGAGPAPEAHVLVPPPGLGRVDGPPPPGPAKSRYGDAWDNHYNSDNFTVAWQDGEGSQTAAASASEALEAAWSALVEDAGWTQPVSSESYLLWVILDPGLAGTGYTTVYSTGEFPGGYPVIYLNPDYAGQTTFWKSLSAHEFNHALQYAVRDYSWNGTEPWYWEASAEWGSQLALPGNDAYAYQVLYYSSHPWYPYDSMTDFHQYGMSVVNAYLEERIGGAHAMRDVWLLSESRTGLGWDEIIEESSGVPIEDFWAGFAGAMGNETLDESNLYEPVLVDGDLVDGQEGLVAYLGTDYFEAPEDATVTVGSAEGDAILGTTDDWGRSIQVQAGDVVGVTGLTLPTADYTLSVGPPGSGDGGDGGSGDGGDGGSGDGGDGGSGDGSDGGSGSGGNPGGGVGGSDAKGCAAVGGAGGAVWLGVLALARRRQPSGS